MYQTLLLIPGQPGKLLEHDSKVEAENILRNVKEAAAWHQGGEVTAIPLNYTVTPQRTFFIDIADVPEEEKEKLVESIKKFIGEKLTKFEGKA
ncbi:hypothetical protein HOS53_gp100 [Klebsiella phage May]|uniref:Uncharacterized protein n=1 Tax=Klebsiella phage May TaxID=2054272 RepID=A0A2H5BNZ8_9CAUD|nr:hypothetical protein HOS53_gp100 [Klebsiella phage May]AUG88060.1 hypothetical protein CPT_May_146 [Klebsiella phage May]